MAISNKRLGMGLVVVGVVAAGYALYEYMSKRGKAQADLANPQVTFSPGSTVAAFHDIEATIRVQNTTAQPLQVGVQGAMVDTSANVVRGHWFTSYGADSETNIGTPSARVAVATIPAGQSGALHLYQRPRQPGQYQSVFWIAVQPPAGELIATDTLFLPLSQVKLNADALQVSANVTVTG